MATVVPPLTLGRKLGAGAFGEVFEGQDSVHGRVAVKVMTRASGESAADWHQRKAGLLAEGQRLSAAEHRNVVRVHSISEDAAGDSIQLCMAFCAGGSLQDAYEKGPLPLDTVREIATNVTLGLDALHSRGMLHRDIKPGNLLRNASGVALLGDFGLVTDRLLHGYGSIAGYKDHIAYEVWSTWVTSAKSDIWALGMTLYRLLHGQEWYEAGQSPAATVPAGGYANKLCWLPHIPAGWRRMIRKMLNDDTSRRYQSAQQVLSALSTLETPRWTAKVDTDWVRWELAIGDRLKVVEWSWQSPRKHEWTAWSEPLGTTGRKRTLGGSSAAQARSKTLSELEDFFERA
ncbi:serine/threonine protein kinase [Schlegelella sp. S2-27]|uniref:non-specific serine/threonine protein kinase n=1 Tax=Caldimonas mangrovi TaxID=2944811 RepID=A0ABT0YKW2_9BURK|nr:serine/threonine-protein kinase [Caldimonas mangrovi]MCM5679350.1 serine/threonine protein kinase [Caldimonas mangrovi]